MSYFNVKKSQDGYSFSGPEHLENGKLKGSQEHYCDSLHEAKKIARTLKQDVFEALGVEGFVDFENCPVSFNFLRDGRFEILYPSLEMLNTQEETLVLGFKTFENFKEAKDFYLESIYKFAKLSGKPLLKFETENLGFNFTSFDNFNPKSELNESPTAINVESERLLKSLKSGRFRSSVYEKSMEDLDSKDKIFKCFDDFFKRESSVLVDLKVKNLRSLSPRQAIFLTVHFVNHHTKYNFDSIGEKGDSSKIDNFSALDMIQDFEENHTNSNWSGNGVCRHIAGLTKFVFDSLKENQLKFNFLNDTYCEFEHNHSYRPESSDEGLKDDFGEAYIKHVWNVFYTIKKNEVDYTILDVTWADFNQENTGLEKLDYTIERNFPVLATLMRDVNLDNENFESQFKLFFDQFIINMKKYEGELSAQKYFVDEFFLACKHINFQELTFKKDLKDEITFLGIRLSKLKLDLNAKDLEKYLSIMHVAGKEQLLTQYIQQQINQKVIDRSLFGIVNFFFLEEVMLKFQMVDPSAFEDFCEKYATFKLIAKAVGIVEYIELSKEELDLLLDKLGFNNKIHFLGICRGLNLDFMGLSLFEKIKKYVHFKISEKNPSFDFERYSDLELMFEFKSLVQ